MSPGLERHVNRCTGRWAGQYFESILVQLGNRKKFGAAAEFSRYTG